MTNSIVEEITKKSNLNPEQWPALCDWSLLFDEYVIVANFTKPNQFGYIGKSLGLHHLVKFRVYKDKVKGSKDLHEITVKSILSNIKRIVKEFGKENVHIIKTQYARTLEEVDINTIK